MSTIQSSFPLVTPKSLHTKINDDTHLIEGWVISLPKQLQDQMRSAFFIGEDINSPIVRFNASALTQASPSPFPWNRLQSFNAAFFDGNGHQIEEYNPFFDGIGQLVNLKKVTFKNFAFAKDNSNLCYVLSTLTLGSNIGCISLFNIPLDSVPIVFKKLVNLKKLELLSNGLRCLQGHFSDDLQQLLVTNNPIERFEGEINCSIFTFSMNLCPQWPRNIEALKKVKSLRLFESPPLPSDFSKLSELVTLCGDVPESDALNSPPSLHRVITCKPISSGSFPFKSIKSLRLQYPINDLSAANSLFKTLSQLPHLTKLELWEYKVSELPDAIGCLKNLVGLYVLDFRGTVSPIIADCKELNLVSKIYLRNKCKESEHFLREWIEEHPSKNVELDGYTIDCDNDYCMLPITPNDFKNAHRQKILDELNVCPIDLTFFEFESANFKETLFRISVEVKVSNLFYNRYFIAFFTSYFISPEEGVAFEKQALKILFDRLEEQLRIRSTEWNDEMQEAFLAGKTCWLKPFPKPPTPVIQVKGSWFPKIKNTFTIPKDKVTRALRLHEHGVPFNGGC